MLETFNEEEYIVTARKWRPQLFKDVIGQEHITKTLINAIKSKRIHHAYLFSGPRGVGKTTTARILARALNCENPKDAEPCNECASCISILEGKSLDIIEIDGASNNSVDDVRRLRENTKYAPSSGLYKMYIIDEVHMLSTSAFNALLKTLEEPPPKLIFIFATTEPHKVPSTILSRCQRFEFHRIEIPLIIEQLKLISQKENIKLDEESYFAIAKKADGSMRDAQSIFDRVVAFCGKNIVYSDLSNALHLIDEEFFFSISTIISEHNIAEMFKIVKDITFLGYDLLECLSGLLEHFRNLLAYKIIGNTDFIESSELFKKKYIEQSKKFTKADILRILNIISSAEQTIKLASQQRIKFELTMIQLASLDSAVDLKELLDAIKNLKIEANKTKDDIISKNSIASDYKELDYSFQQKDQKNELDKKIISEKEDKKIYEELNEKNYLEKNWYKFIATYKEKNQPIQVMARSKAYKATFFQDEILLEITKKIVFEDLEKIKSQFEKFLNEFYKKKVKLTLSFSEINEDSQSTQYKNIEPSKQISKEYVKHNENELKTSNENMKYHVEKSNNNIETTLKELFEVEKLP